MEGFGVTYESLADSWRKLVCLHRAISGLNLNVAPASATALEARHEMMPPFTFSGVSTILCARATRHSQRQGRAFTELGV